MLDAGVVSETAVQPSRDIVLILHHAADAAAVWLATALREHIGDRVLLLTIDELMYSKSIQHHFDSSLDESTFKLFDGREIRSACIAGVINRLCTPPDRHLEQVAQADRLYSTQELHAFWLGWLNSLPVPVINPPRPNALLGLSADEVVLQHTAATAGLPCQPLEFEVTSNERPVAHGNGAHGN
ncbi:MAG: hypothetical protein SFV81_26510, partial [Pirellulaceae bacterium]|nr:hypothetical protein [Pirellulaceae bacterium]